MDKKSNKPNNKYDVGNVSDMLGTIKFDIDNIDSMVKVLSCSISYADLMAIADNEGLITLHKKDILNCLEVLQNTIKDVRDNISDLQDAKEIRDLTYRDRGGK